VILNLKLAFLFEIVLYTMDRFPFIFHCPRCAQHILCIEHVTFEGAHTHTQERDEVNPAGHPACCATLCPGCITPKVSDVDLSASAAARAVGQVAYSPYIFHVFTSHLKHQKNGVLRFIYSELDACVNSSKPIKLKKYTALFNAN